MTFLRNRRSLLFSVSEHTIVDVVPITSQRYNGQ
jgi:hypothetical protein